MSGRTACPTISITHDTARQISAFRSAEALQTTAATMHCFQVNQGSWTSEATLFASDNRGGRPPNGAPALWSFVVHFALFSRALPTSERRLTLTVASFS